MSPTERQRAIEQVKKLRRLAQSTTFEGERENAEARIQIILVKYGLTEDEIKGLAVFDAYKEIKDLNDLMADLVKKYGVVHRAEQNNVNTAKQRARERQQAWSEDPFGKSWAERDRIEAEKLMKQKKDREDSEK